MESRRGRAEKGKQTNNTTTTVRINSSQPTPNARKSSFSDTLNNFTDKANPFYPRRRMTTAALSSSHSLASLSINQHHQSRLPTPSGIPCNTSFFGSLNPLITSGSHGKSNLNESTAGSERRTHEISDKHAQLSFFNHENQAQGTWVALAPQQKREISTKIEHRGLMAPIQPTPLPRSSTVGNLDQQHGIINTPSFMRPTSSSANRRRQSVTIAQRTEPPMPHPPSSTRVLIKSPAPQSMRYGPHRPTTRTPAPGTHVFPSASSITCFPNRKDSLPVHFSPPARAVATATKTYAVSREPAVTHQSTIPRSAHIPPATRIPTPATALPTPEYEDINEDVRDRRAKYIELTHSNDSEDESELTATEDADEAQMLCLAKYNRGVINEVHRQMSNHKTQPQSSVEYSSAEDAVDSPDLNVRTANSNIPHLVLSPKSSTFWLGRHTSLSDRFRTETLPSPPLSPTPSPSSASSPTLTPSHSCPTKSTTMHDAARRNRRIFHHLHSLCTTDEARSSLEKFQMKYEVRYGVDGEGKGASGAAAAAAAKDKAERERGKGEKKTKGWLDAIKGRNRS